MTRRGRGRKASSRRSKADRCRRGLQIRNSATWWDAPRDEDGVLVRAPGGTGRGAQPAGAAAAAGNVPAGGNLPPGGVGAANTVGAGGFEGCYVPGTQVADYRPFHAGKLVPA